MAILADGFGSRLWAVVMGAGVLVLMVVLLFLAYMVLTDYGDVLAAAVFGAAATLALGCFLSWLIRGTVTAPVFVIAPIPGAIAAGASTFRSMPR